MAQTGNEASPSNTSWLRDERTQLIEKLLDEFAGTGNGEEIIRDLLDGKQAPRKVARTIGRSPAFELLHKAAHTLDIGRSGPIESDPKYVGLDDWDPKLPFMERFNSILAPILKERADGFRVIFEVLARSGRCPTIVETGCLRIPGNWAGDGQSTFMFDSFVDEVDGTVFSIDITVECLATARKACSGRTHLIWNDSVAALHGLGSMIAKPIALLYLDSFDFDENNPAPSAIHHAVEFMAARKLIGAGTLVAIDDYALGGAGGKGSIVDQYFASLRIRPLYQGYQKIWQLPY